MNFDDPNISTLAAHNYGWAVGYKVGYKHALEMGYANAYRDMLAKTVILEEPPKDLIEHSDYYYDYMIFPIELDVGGRIATVIINRNLELYGYYKCSWSLSVSNENVIEYRLDDWIVSKERFKQVITNSLNFYDQSLSRLCDQVYQDHLNAIEDERLYSEGIKERPGMLGLSEWLSRTESLSKTVYYEPDKVSIAVNGKEVANLENVTVGVNIESSISSDRFSKELEEKLMEEYRRNMDAYIENNTPKTYSDLDKWAAENPLPFTAQLDGVTYDNYNDYVIALYKKYSAPGLKAKQSCQHEFKEYVGLMESYKYCTKCDHKE
jgi:hypothetical protein